MSAQNAPFCLILIECDALSCVHGPLTRYVISRVAHAPGMPGTFSPRPLDSDPDMHHGTCVTHVPWCIPGSLTSGFLWSRRQGNSSRHSKRMGNPRFYVSSKMPMGRIVVTSWLASGHYIKVTFSSRMNILMNGPNGNGTLWNKYFVYCDENVIGWCT